MPHKPVLLQEVLKGLNLKEGSVVVDGTLGGAGHSIEMLKKIGAAGRLVGIDRDPASIERCRESLKLFKQAVIMHGNFLNIPEILRSLNIVAVDAVLLDVGFSSFQIEDASRGFSFEREGPLDMRFDPTDGQSAADLVNHLPEVELSRIFFKYGEEPWANRIAREICQVRKTQNIETTQQLIEVVNQALPAKFRLRDGKRPYWMRRHPATKVFQALRIAVNGELDALSDGMAKVWSVLKPCGRLGVISFHSLEDRIAKFFFRGMVQEGKARLVFKKPVCASELEQEENPRSRSAKLRVAEKIE